MDFTVMILSQRHDDRDDEFTTEEAEGNGEGKQSATNNGGRIREYRIQKNKESQVFCLPPSELFPPIVVH